MSSSRGPQDIRRDAITAMGCELGERYDDLRQQLLVLHYKWQEFNDLFEPSPERVALLTSVARVWFSVVRNVLYEDVLLHIARLTDPPVSRDGKKSLTLRSLPALVPDRALQREVKQLLKAAESACAFARDIRNRALAHIDLETYLAQHPTPLPTATSDDVAAALKSLSNVLNALEEHFQGAPVHYGHIGVPGTVGVASLIYYLQRGLDASR